MRIFLAALAFATAAAPCVAQQYAANDGYRVCAAEQTEQGRAVVRTACGDVQRLDMPAALTSLADLESARAARESFTREIDTYATCVSDFIGSYRRPGGDAASLAPDQAACAHSWAEEQATEAVRAFGRACIDFSNRSMMDSRLSPWSGECYPPVSGDKG
ncbi:hypothetical protein [Hyphomonas sp.]|uniref:hypothetical protein n=1 Tax=Hyphomonas sp. TaxID=87 RepID=UPI0030F81A4D